MTQQKRLNLFNKTTNRNVTSIIADKTIFYSTIVGAILFVAFIVLIVLTITTNSRVSTATQEQKQLVEYLSQNKTAEAQTTYFLQKKDQLKTFLKDDAAFLPYYTILKNSLPPATSSATIQTMKIDKSKKTEFLITFINYDDMYRYIHYVESEDFLRNFESLKLTTFSLNQLGGVKGYQLHFEGKFMNLPEVVN